MQNKIVSLLAVALVLLPPVAHAGSIMTDGTAFKDLEGRTLILRGVNLGGDSKTPAVLTPDPRTVSFVGRPFPIKAADEHFRRLEGWGFSFIRLLTPWEAIEHSGPGQYDKAYLDYLHEVVRIAGKHGIAVYIDVHQDFYSRAFGGNGAPYWTSQSIGLGIDRQTESLGKGALGPGLRLWPPTSGRFGTLTMDTLFWAGDEFAPGIAIDGVPVQHYLQDHFIGAARAVAERLRDLPNVVGFDTYNEPMPGFIGVADLREPEPMMTLTKSLLAPGRPGTVRYWDYFSAASGFTPEGDPAFGANRIWADGAVDVWRRVGVWDVVDGKPKLLKPDYFATDRRQKVLFGEKLRDFQAKFAKTIRAILPDALIFQQRSPFETASPAMALNLPRVVSEPHFYDNAALVTQHFEPYRTTNLTTGAQVEGAEAIERYYADSIRQLYSDATALGGLPTLIGETGITFNMNGAIAYRSGDFSAQDAQAALLFAALDKNLASYSIWNYAASNTNEKGDGWVNEDFSIFSESQRLMPTDINSGGRGLKSIIRPYAQATAGTPLEMSFNIDRKAFSYRFRAEPGIVAPTVIFVPRFQYPSGFVVKVSGGRAKISDKCHVQVIEARGVVRVDILPK